MNLKKWSSRAVAVGCAFLLISSVFAEEEIKRVNLMYDMEADLPDDEPTDSIPDDFDEPELPDDEPTDSIPDDFDEPEFPEDEPTDSIPDDFDEPELPEEFGILGDVDGDREITTSDASAILRYIVGYVDPDIEIQYGDVDADEEITTSDASAILRYIVGYTDNSSIGQQVDY